MLKLSQYCNYIIIVMQLLLLFSAHISTKLEKLPYFARIKTGPNTALILPRQTKASIDTADKTTFQLSSGICQKQAYSSANVECQRDGHGPTLIILRLRRTISLFVVVNIPPGIPLAKFANFMDFKGSFSSSFDEFTRTTVDKTVYRWMTVYLLE